MSAIGWECAQGEPPPVTLPVAATVAIAPPDDSVDTNKVIIQGTGTIYLFGPSAVATTGFQTDADGNPILDNNGDPIPIRTPIHCTKQIIFEPTSSSQPIVLAVGPSMILLGGASRSIDKKMVGTYECDLLGNWTETNIVDMTNAGGGGIAGPFRFASLPPPSAAPGYVLRISDGAASLAWGAAVTAGGGSTPYLLWSNGTNWTVLGK